MFVWPAGGLAAPVEPATQPAGDAETAPLGETAPPGETAPTEAAPADELDAGDPNDDVPPTQVTKFLPATAEQHAEAMAKARERVQLIGEKLGVKLTELETPHFLIFTNWPAAEHDFLKRHVETAYANVAKHFDLSPKETIFVGKLACYVYANRSQFERHAAEIDGKPASSRTAGYYLGSSSTGRGHILMGRGDLGPKAPLDAKSRWARVLTHEFTHAFVARYRTNRRVPGWLNEGLAEVVAYGTWPSPNPRERATKLAKENADVGTVFRADQKPPFDYYPAMMMMVTHLTRTNPKAFRTLFDAIKDGADPESALKQHYGLDYAGLDAAWRKNLVRRR